MTFEQQWDAARYNAWYWVSYAFMLLVPVLGAVAVMSRFRSRGVRRGLTALLALTCLFVTAGGTMLSIRQKWDRRYLLVGTARENQLASERDGANLVFAPIIGFACGAFAVLLTYATAEYVGRIVPASNESE